MAGVLDGKQEIMFVSKMDGLLDILDRASVDRIARHVALLASCFSYCVDEALCYRTIFP